VIEAIKAEAEFYPASADYISPEILLGCEGPQAVQSVNREMDEEFHFPFVS
jgi:hypothetical protein